MPDETDNAIAFEEVDRKETPPVQDPTTSQLQNQVIRKIEREHIEGEVRKDLGEEKTKGAPFPKEVPELFFRFGADLIGCERFRTDDKENEMLAKHLTNIFGGINSLVASVLIILIILLSKLLACKDAIMAKFKTTQAPAPTETAPARKGLPELIR